MHIYTYTLLNRKAMYLILFQHRSFLTLKTCREGILKSIFALFIYRQGCFKQNLIKFGLLVSFCTSFAAISLLNRVIIIARNKIEVYNLVHYIHIYSR